MALFALKVNGLFPCTIGCHSCEINKSFKVEDDKQDGVISRFLSMYHGSINVFC